MSKKVEPENKELMSEDVPDLWGRIETGLESKQAAARKRIKWKRYSTWGVALAASLCLLVTAPVILSEMGDRSGSNSAAESFAAEEYNNASEGMEVADGAMDYVNDNADVNETEDFPAEVSEKTSGEVAPVDTVKARVLEISVEDGRTVYTIQFEEAGDTEFVAGEELKLYGEEGFEEELLEGESYLLEIFSRGKEAGGTEYLIHDIKAE